MLRYLNTDNGQVVEVPDWMQAKYDRSCNMKRLDDAEGAPESAGAPEVRVKPRKKATK